MVRQGEVEGSPPPPDGGVRVVFMGTSLTEGYGLSRSEEAFPGRIQSLADSLGYPVEVVNAGLSGETSAGALARIDWISSRPMDVLVLEVGANDGLRGLDPGQLEANLREIVRRVTSRRPDVPILLLTMEAPPNLGREYAARFRDVYGQVAREPGAVLGPFVLEGVAADPALNQPDGIHPTAEGHLRMAHTVWEALEPMVREAAGVRGAVQGSEPGWSTGG